MLADALRVGVAGVPGAGDVERGDLTAVENGARGSQYRRRIGASTAGYRNTGRSAGSTMSRSRFTSSGPAGNRYQLTALGRRAAVMFTKAHGRVLAPGLTALDPALPTDIGKRHPLATTWRTLNRELDRFITNGAGHRLNPELDSTGNSIPGKRGPSTAVSSGDVLGDELIVDVGVDGLWSEAGEESLAVFLDAHVVLFGGANDEFVALDEVE